MISDTDAHQVAHAITAAVDALDAWTRTPLETREQVVRQFAITVAANAESLTDLLMSEVSKLRDDAAAEVAAVIAKVEISIEMQRTRRAELTTPLTGFHSQVRYRPLGVVVVLGPFNFPAHLPSGQIIPALLAGNSVVFKPSELAPRVADWLANIWTQAGLPQGVLNVIQGGPQVAKAAIADERIAAVMFTGGYQAGLAIHRQLAGRPDVLLALEMGGNNPLVLVSPYNISDAAAWVIKSAFVTAGQRCTCARRLIVVADELGQQAIDAIVESANAMNCGLPHDDPPVAMGPVVSAQAAERILRVQNRWLDAGGLPLLKMMCLPRSPALLSPGIIDMTACETSTDEEWFGPLLQLYRVADFQAAIRVANDTKYGLAAGLIGGDEAMFEEFRHCVRAGIVNWNAATTGASGRLPFGGIGYSGNHRSAGSYAIDFCNDPIATLIKER